jgi:hypothetical protein
MYYLTYWKLDVLTEYIKDHSDIFKNVTILLIRAYCSYKFIIFLNNICFSFF